MSIEKRSFSLPESEGTAEIESLPENLKIFPETKSTMTIEDLRSIVPEGDVISLDFVLTDKKNPIETWNTIKSGDKILGYSQETEKGAVINLDHHSNRPEFFAQISTGNLVIDYVKEYGPVTDKSVIIHHYDADSVLSALILTGVLPPEEKFGEAVIAADHTGEENVIADLLQATQDKKDLEFQLRNLKILLKTDDVAQLDPEAQTLLANRQEARKLLEKAEFVEVAEVESAQDAKVFLTTLPFEQQVEGEFAPAAVPEAAIIVIAKPMKDKSTGELKAGYWEIKVRAGKKFLAGKSLNSLNLVKYGGRWNAGSTNRSGGVSLEDLRELPELVEYFEGANQPTSEDVPNLFSTLIAKRYSSQIDKN